jgi:hypothetical protein
MPFLTTKTPLCLCAFVLRSSTRATFSKVKTNGPLGKTNKQTNKQNEPKTAICLDAEKKIIKYISAIFFIIV